VLCRSGFAVLPSPECGQTGVKLIIRSAPDFDPNRKSIGPLGNNGGRARVFQFFPGGFGKNDSLVKTGQQFDGVDQDQVIERGGIGDDEHELNSQATLASRSTSSRVNG
jgi:hypothetical protein